MTLKEKFENVEIMFESQIGILKYDELCESSNQCVKIADEFAIGFAEFSWNKELITINDCGYFEYKFNLYTRKKLLEIYKKEKGL